MFKLYGDVPVCGDPVQENALHQIIAARATCDYAALMADHHMGWGVPIGGVVASRTHVSPTAVGFDIACGNKAARLDIDASHVKARISEIMDRIANEISFGVGRSNDWKIEDELFDSPVWDTIPALKTLAKGRPMKDLAHQQLGTVGSGNHYVDLFTDESDRVWIGVHFGSRGLGHRVATWFMGAAGASQGMEAPPVWIPERSDLGEQYIEAMQLAGRYAYAGRDAVVARVAAILEAEVVEEVHNHHNFAWRETRDGETFWVCRKGATPAYPGQKGFVGGSMGDDAVIVEGVDSPESKELFHSTIHGAGRVMSRSQATGRNRKGIQNREPAISRQEMFDWVKSSGVELRGADVDEAPQAYKRLNEVLTYQGHTIRVLHTLRPIGVAMAGSEVVDPYKD